MDKIMKRFMFHKFITFREDGRIDHCAVLPEKVDEICEVCVSLYPNELTIVIDIYLN